MQDTTRDIQKMEDAQGIMGIGYWKTSRSRLQPSPPLSLFLPASSIPFFPIFTLDLNPSHIPSFLHVGGLPPNVRSTDVVWGPSAGTNAYYHQLYIPYFSICGINLLSAAIMIGSGSGSSSGSDSSSVAGMIDTASGCLGLPQEIFDIFITWVPVKCIPKHQELPLQQMGEVCYYVYPDWTPEQGDTPPLTILPRIIFSNSINGSLLALPLTDILFPMQYYNFLNANASRVCVVRTAPLIWQSPIIFGAMTLRSLMVVMHMETGSVGLVSKIPVLNPDNKEPVIGSYAGCVAPARCRGMQTQDNVVLNDCVNPNCGDYFFFQFDSEGKRCELSTSFWMTSLFLLGCFLTIELLYNSTLYSLIRKSDHTVPLSE